MGASETKAAIRWEEVWGDREDWDSELKELADQYIQERAMAGVIQGALEAGLSPAMAVVNPNVLNWIAGYKQTLASRINDTSYERVQNSIKDVLKVYNAGSVEEAVTAGAPRQAFVDAITAALGPETSEYRAEMIAATELSRAEQNGRLDQLKEAGAKRKIWRANPDCCDYCAAVDGTEVEIGDSFFKMGDAVALTGEDGSVSTLNVDYEDVDVALLHPWCRCSFEVTFD